MPQQMTTMGPGPLANKMPPIDHGYSSGSDVEDGTTPQQQVRLKKRQMSSTIIGGRSDSVARANVTKSRMFAFLDNMVERLKIKGRVRISRRYRTEQQQ